MTNILEKVIRNGVEYIFKDGTLQSKSASSGGTDLSLVTTGEKYTWNNKQTALVSGTNIKTINNQSILGSGNITISGGGGGSGDVSYEDFEIATATSGATLIISNLTTSFTPSANFTIASGTVKEGMQYIVRIDTGGTAYTMTLGTGVTNPYEEDITLTANTMTTLVFLATSSSTLELFSVRSYSTAVLLTSAEIVSMATNEGQPRTNIIAELNTYTEEYYNQLNNDGYLSSFAYAENSGIKITSVSGTISSGTLSIGRVGESIGPIHTFGDRQGVLIAGGGGGDN